MLKELKYIEQKAERLEIDSKLLQHTNEEVLRGATRVGSYSTRFVDRLVNDSQLEYAGITMGVVQPFWTCLECYEISQIIDKNA